MRNLKLTISYDGSAYAGWQIQPNGPTIQQELSKAVASVTGENVNPVASGRTDSGVHAVEQVVGWRTESSLSCAAILKALNANLPDEIVVHSVEEAEDSFDPVRDAKWKLYRYVYHDGPSRDVFMLRYCWRVHRRLDVAAMAVAAAFVEGRHDFRCFESEWPNRASSVRTVRRCRPTRLGDLVLLDVEADGFLYNMVRAIAGTLAEVGRGKRPPEEVGTLIAAGDRQLAGPTAPARGLFLIRVDYRDADSGAVGSGRDTL
jgi:tRNA pseudouridine38-40 synthase